MYARVAQEFAFHLSKHRATLIYGGGNIGLMGVIADEMLRNSAAVIGVIPDFLVQREVGHQNLSELIVVKSMHERKRRMADMADSFVVLPGGMGTLDEMAEILTWKQLGLIDKPIGILNVNGFFDSLLDYFETMVKEGFLKRANLRAIKISENPFDLLTSLGVVAP